jgi:pilus assembly protein CpaE
MANILVIDDNTDLLRMMRLILQDRGKYDVTLSADGADGLSRALTFPPDLVIIDVMMPGLTGYDVVRRLREQPQTAQIPILVLTARGQMIDRQTALQAGADEHMAKPVTPQLLLDKVEELLTLHKPAVCEIDECMVIGMMSLRGGVGVTTLAVNLALGKLSSHQVCLVDLSPSSGQVTLHLRIKAQQTWAALPGLGSDLTFEALNNLLTLHASGLQVLAAPFEPIYANTLSSTMVDGMLMGLKSRFEVLVLDIPPLIDVVAAAVLDSANHIVMVLTPEVGAVQSSVAMLRVMDELQDKVKVVLNHISPQPGVPEAAIEKALRRSLTHQIPYDQAQMAALSKGKPLAWANPSSPLATATKKLLEKLT